ncbi:accessory gene regulator ArgB-like protein [Cohnella sp. CFH 77786]|uniref:accessory gene regulator ArgB-like protein n=1 Tax=Cohnella sp. CFH 77786 TaxID=2662265 RepID=UPI001C60B6FF|nr:accessory gene regulator B family protein [Cohnella sp. CFH 77786]
MIEAVSERISGYLYRHNDRRNVSQEVMKFALIGLLTNGCVIVLSLIIGWLGGNFSATLLSLASMAALRLLAGGYHINPPSLCIVLSTAAVTLIPYIPAGKPVLYVFTAISALLVWRFAPADLRGKTRISERTLQQMKYGALLLVASSLFIQSGIMATALFLVSLTLIPIKRR